jgi:hypothetical protein
VIDNICLSSFFVGICVRYGLMVMTVMAKMRGRGASLVLAIPCNCCPAELQRQ